MTPHTKAFAPLIKAVATVVREYVTLAIADLSARVTAIEDRPIPKDGTNGAPGPAGEKGDPGPAGEISPALEERLVAIETRTAPVVELPADVQVATFTDALRKAIDVDSITLPVRVQKRVLRDRQGRIDRVIEEPVMERVS